MATAEVLVQQPIPAGGAGKGHGGGIGSRVGGLLKSKGKKPEEVKGAPSASDGGQASETASTAAAAAGEVASQKSDDVPRYKRYANTAVKAFGKKGRSKEASEASKESGDAQTEAVVVVEKPAETREGEQASEAAPGDAVKEADGEKSLPEPADKETEQQTPSDDAAAMSPSSPASPAIKLARRLSHRAGNALKRSTSRTRSASDGQDDATTSPNADTAAPPVSKASLLAKQVSSRAGDLFTLKGKAGDATAKENGKDEGKDETKEDNTAAGVSTSETEDAKPSESAVADDTEPPTSPIDKPLPHPPTLTRRLSSRVGDMVAKAKLKAADVVEHVHSPKPQADAATSTVSAPGSEHPTRPKLTTRLSSKVGSLIKSPGGHAAAKEGEVVAVKADGSTEVKSADDEAPKADDVVVVADDTKPDTPDAPKDANDRAEEPKVEEEATTADGVKVDDTKPTDETEDKAAAAPADAVEQPADAHQATGGGGIFGLASRIGGFVKSRIVSESEAPPPLPPKEADKEQEDEGGVVKSEGEDRDKDGDKAKESEGESEGKPAEASKDAKADAQPAVEDETLKELSDEAKPPVDDAPTPAPPAEQAAASAPSPAAAAPPPAPPTSFQRTHSKTEGVQKLGRRLSARVGDVFKASLKSPKAPAPPPKDDVKGKGKEVEEGGTSAQEDAELKVEGQDTPGDGAEVPKKDEDGEAQPGEFVVVDNKDAPKASADETTTTTVPATQPTPSTSSVPPSSFAKPRQTAKKIGRRLSARVGDMFKKDQAREREKEKEKEAAVVATPTENQVDQPAVPVPSSETTPQPDGEGTTEDKPDSSPTSDDKPQPAQDDDAATLPASVPVQASDSTEAVENHSAPSTTQDKGKGKDKLATTTAAAAAAVKDKDADLPEKPLPSKPSKSARAREAALDAKRQLSIRASELLKPKPRLDVHLAGGATSPTSPNTSGVDVKGKGKQKAAADKDEFVVVEGLGVDAATGVVDVTTAPQGVTVEGEPAGTSTNNDAGGGATGATATGSTSPPVTTARTRKTSVTELGRRLSTRVTGALDGLKARAHAAASSSRGSAVPPPTPPKDEPAVKDEGRHEDGAPEPVAKDEDTGTEPSAETEAATSPVGDNEKTEAQATDVNADIEAPLPPPKPTESTDSEAKDPHTKRISTRVTELINKAKHKFPSDSSRGDKEAETVDSEEWNVVEGGGESEAQVDGAAPAEGVPAATSTDGGATPNGKRKHRLSLKFRAPNLKGLKKKSGKSEGGEGSKTSSKAGSPEKELPEPSPEVPPKDEVAAGEKDGEGRKDSEDVAKEDVVKEENGAVSQTETKDAVEENKIVNVGDDVEADAPAVPKKDTVEG
ncbi:hypothetical protein CC2G_009894 [Coprinopsis cinerea AmutBmut pab1-1]|nr:hypothetical protein CC2G_009894 [Coprinopsis cinerea AmutBmut pab1-1]